MLKACFQKSLGGCLIAGLTIKLAISIEQDSDRIKVSQHSLADGE
jgi:hypothetical protein